jgi:NADH:ubiquinone oxidoreductase subunit E
MTDNKAKAQPSACQGEVNEEELYAQLDRIIELHKDKEGALIPILQSSQNLFGYLPDKALKRISRKLGKPYSEVAGVVGFYSYFSTTPKVSILFVFVWELPAMFVADRKY